VVVIRGGMQKEGFSEQRDFDLRSKLRNKQGSGRVGGIDPNKDSHCFNCNKDGK
jgi:hypothetical protein